MRRAFGTLATIEGFAVIDEETGREVAMRATRASANGAAMQLNYAAAGGSKALEGMLHYGHAFGKRELSHES